MMMTTEELIAGRSPAELKRSLKACRERHTHIPRSRTVGTGG